MTLRSASSILSAQDYYPYGEIMRSYVQNVANDKYKFTGKERGLDEAQLKKLFDLNAIPDNDIAGAGKAQELKEKGD